MPDDIDRPSHPAVRRHGPGLRDALEAGVRVLDVGCGCGLVMMRLAEQYPRTRVVGIDLSGEAIAFARLEAARRALGNAEFIVGDATDLAATIEPGSSEVVTAFNAIHDQARPLEVLRGIHAALAPAGVFLMQDIGGTSDLARDIAHPLGTFLYTISCMHCMTVSLAQGGEGLGAMWGERKTREYLHAAGFRSVETHRLAHDVVNNWYVVRK